jgi:hypothetical protein
MNMTNAQDFHKTLVASDTNTDPYRQALVAITKATGIQISALASELAWQTWGAESKPAGK